MKETTPEQQRKMLEDIISPKSDVEKIKECSDERLRELRDLVLGELFRRSIGSADWILKGSGNKEEKPKYPMKTYPPEEEKKKRKP